MQKSIVKEELTRLRDRNYVTRFNPFALGRACARFGIVPPRAAGERVWAGFQYAMLGGAS